VVSLSDRGGSEIVSALGLPRPAAAALEELRPRRRDDQERHVADAVEQLVDEVEQRVVCPMQVLEDEHERALVCERLEEVSPGRECLGPKVGGAGLATAEADKNAQIRREPAGFGRILDDPAHGLPDLALDRLGRVPLQDAGLRLHHLLERPEADAVAVGERAALTPRHRLLGRGDRILQLRDEP